jgi:hypothetical protein
MIGTGRTGCKQGIRNSKRSRPRESKKAGVYEWTLTMLRFFLNRAVFETTQRGRGGAGTLKLVVSRYFRLEHVG